MITVGAKATFCAAHKMPQHPELHGHSYVVWAFTTGWSDAEDWQKFVQQICNSIDHKTLPSELATMESIAKYLGEETGAEKLQVVRPVEGLMAEWGK